MWLASGVLENLLQNLILQTSALDTVPAIFRILTKHWRWALRAVISDDDPATLDNAHVCLHWVDWWAHNWSRRKTTFDGLAFISWSELRGGNSYWLLMQDWIRKENLLVVLASLICYVLVWMTFLSCHGSWLFCKSTRAWVEWFLVDVF